MSAKYLNTVSAVGIAVALASFGGVARAADAPMDYDTWYVSVFGGFNMARVHASFSTDVYDFKMKDGFTVGAAVGSYVADGVRLERELSYSRNSNKSARFGNDDFRAQSGRMSGLFMMTNMWKDFRVSERFQPYVGGGLGVALLSGEGDGYSSPYDFSGELAFAVQAGAGVRYGISDKLALDVGYRYRAAMDASQRGGVDGFEGAFSYSTHTLQAGLTYAFQSNGVVMPSPEGDSGLYLSLFGGLAMPDTTSLEYSGEIFAINQKNGFAVGTAVGTQLAPGLRGEVELSYLRSKISGVEFDANSSPRASGTVNQTYLLMNIWKDFNLGAVQPYFGGGLGVGLTSFSNGVVYEGGSTAVPLSNKTGAGIAGQFGVGARMPVSDSLMIDVGYRYKSIVDAMIIGGDNGFSRNYDVATHNHILQVGGTYNFGGAVTEPAPEMTNKYFSVFGGLSRIVDTHFNYSAFNYIADFKTGFTVGAAVGGNITEKLRGELELSYVDGKMSGISSTGGGGVGSGGDVNGTYLLANLWRDVDMGGFSPYFGGGLGLAVMDVDINFNGSDQNQDTSVALAAQVGTGVRFDLTDRLTMDVGYRLKSSLAAFAGGTDDGDYTMASYYTHIGQVGLSWKF
jgi:opacity protein-like surface antigen